MYVAISFYIHNAEAIYFLITICLSMYILIFSIYFPTFHIYAQFHLLFSNLRIHFFFYLCIFPFLTFEYLYKPSFYNYLCLNFRTLTLYPYPLILLRIHPRFSFIFGFMCFALFFPTFHERAKNTRRITRFSHCNSSISYHRLFASIPPLQTFRVLSMSCFMQCLVESSYWRNSKVPWLDFSFQITL